MADATFQRVSSAGSTNTQSEKPFHYTYVLEPHHHYMLLSLSLSLPLSLTPSLSVSLLSLSLSLSLSSYLKEFRVDQCKLFLQHKCTQHRPYTCFYWHFMNQRRRRPVRKRDGTFNYSPDIYCSSYDENTGICPNGDESVILYYTS